MTHPITIVSQTEVLSSYAKFLYEGGDNTSQHTQLIIARVVFKIQVISLTDIALNWHGPSLVTYVSGSTGG